MDPTSFVDSILKGILLIFALPFVVMYGSGIILYLAYWRD